jgi:hypothetical protein
VTVAVYFAILRSLLSNEHTSHRTYEVYFILIPVSNVTTVVAVTFLDSNFIRNCISTSSKPCKNLYSGVYDSGQ